MTDKPEKQRSNENLLIELEDEYGVMRVVEVGAYRFLEFGDSVEQSCVFKGDAAWLEYDYTRAMLLGALAHECPESALFLGLGAGSLTQACLKYLSLEDVEVIELRPDVPRLAMEYLGFSDDPRLTLRIGDASELVQSAEMTDLLFVDLYTDEGPGEAHLMGEFLQRCRDRLNPGGWLIINQWEGKDGKPLGAALLRGTFQRHYWECPVKEGNVVLWVPAALDQRLDAAGLLQRAQVLEPALGYPISNFMAQVRPAS